MAAKTKKKLGGPKIGGDGPRQAKADAVSEVEQKVGGSAAVLLSEYRGLTVGELKELRTGLREADAEYRVYKNTLARIAADRLGLADLKEYLEGPTAFTFANGDPVVAAKALTEYAKKAPALVLKAGILDGRILSPDEVKVLGSLSSREVMLAQAAGMFLAPLQRAANLLAAGFNQLGSMLVQLRDRLPAVEDGSAPATDAAPAEGPGDGSAAAEADTGDASEPAAATAETTASEAGSPEPDATAAPEEPAADTGEAPAGGDATPEQTDQNPA